MYWYLRRDNKFYYDRGVRNLANKVKRVFTYNRDVLKENWGPQYVHMPPIH